MFDFCPTPQAKKRQRPDEQKYLATSLLEHVCPRQLQGTSTWKTKIREEQTAKASGRSSWLKHPQFGIDGQTIQTREKTDELLFVTCRHTYTIVGV